MIVCIGSTKFSILVIFISSLLLSITIQSIISTDSVGEENLTISRSDSTDENNQTVTIDENNSQLIDDVLLDTNAESVSPEILPIAENDLTILSTENKSEIIDELSLPSASPLVGDNQSTPSTSDDQKQTTPPTTKRNLSNINSFEEWKQQQLHADLLKKGETSAQNGIPSETSLTGSSKGTSSGNNQQSGSNMGLSKKGKLRKNFASASCGAKILAHNVEAQNVPSILSSSPDEYMLNPCNAKIWFAIELCESIRILNIEIANFELFSSVPKTFRVSASDRYPTKDWHRHHLGTFNASFNRTIQSFYMVESTTYLKYVKFELLDFHGHEHYCPLSVVRIHGSNVEDEIMIMEDNTNSNIQDENENENENDDDDNNSSNEQQVGGIIGSAILDLAKRVFRRQTIRGTPSTTAIPTTEENILKTDCHQSVMHGPINNVSIDAWRYSDTFKQCIAEFLRGLWSNFDTCTTFLSQICFQSTYCCQCPLINNNNNRSNQSLTTLNFYINPCGYYHVLTNRFVCKKENIIELNKTISQTSATITGDITQDFIEKNVTVDKNDTVIVNDESTNSSNDQPLSNNPNSTLLNETQSKLESNRTNEQPSLYNIFDDATLMPETQTLSNITNQTSSQSSTIEPINIDFNVTEQSIDINNSGEIITTPSPPSSTLNNNEGLPSIISSPWLKGMLVNTKSLPELFKIIEKLNFNLTLSNRYLQELSQHYVKKLDETQQTTDLLLKSSKAADEKLQNLEEHLYKMQENFDDMSNRLIKLEAWLPSIIFIIISLFIWCLWATCRLIRLRRILKSIDQREKIMKIEQITKDHNDDDDDGNAHPIICNGVNKRKLSTDSSDSTNSNPTRSQRVPDLTLSKIKENGIDTNEHKIKKKSSNKTRHLLPLSTIYT